MFMGIVEELGSVQAIRRMAVSCEITIRAYGVLADAHVGDSIAVNGVCLTVTALGASTFTADVMHETLDRSSLGSLVPGSPVNLERAMPADGRFGGHIVSGHIDGTGTVSAIRQDGNAVWYTIKAPASILTYVVEKGSIAIEGISLTVARVGSEDFSVSVIPHTRGNTNLASKKIGDAVNLENDVVGKYVGRLLAAAGQIPASLAGIPAGAANAAGRSSSQGSGNAEAASSQPRKGLTLDVLLENGF